MRAVDLIEKKKRGGELSFAEIDFLVRGAVAGDIPDYQLSAFFMAVYFRGMTERETADLTLSMRDSGDKIEPSVFISPAVDKHSSGGVGDSTTLVLAPVVAACGGSVAKLSGRGLGFTGGTIDKLESVRGLNTALTPDGFIRQVNDIGIAVSSQSANLCPADKIFYALRDLTATVDSIPLIASSIMSKKLAGGASALVLDVKCGAGAFMKDDVLAAELARKMVDIGKRCGRKTSAFITDMNEPLDSFIGNNLELYGALRVLYGEKNRLYELSKILGAEMLRLVGIAEPEKSFDRAIESGAALEKLKQMITAEGGVTDVVDKPELLLNAAVKTDVTAAESGVVAAIQPEVLGNAVCKLGGGRTRKEDVIDPTVGIEMRVSVGDKVKAGDVLAVVYHRNEDVSSLLAEVLGAVKIGYFAEKRPLVFQKISAD